MSWYRDIKQSGKLRDFGKGVGMGALLGLPALAHQPKSPAMPQRTPAPVVQQMPQKPTQPQQNVPPLMTHTPDYPSAQPKPEATQKAPVQPQSQQRVHIDPKRIVAIESSGNPNAVSGVGATGMMGLMPDTWDEIVQKMGKPYSRADMTNGSKNIEVGNYYFNTEVPKLLRSRGIPDSVETRIAAYNWGIGNLHKVYKKYGKDWLQHAPTETQNYVKKYLTHP